VWAVGGLPLKPKLGRWGHVLGCPWVKPRRGVGDAGTHFSLSKMRWRWRSRSAGAWTLQTPCVRPPLDSGVGVARQQPDAGALGTQAGIVASHGGGDVESSVYSEIAAVAKSKA